MRSIIAKFWFAFTIRNFVILFRNFRVDVHIMHACDTDCLHRSLCWYYRFTSLVYGWNGKLEVYLSRLYECDEALTVSVNGGSRVWRVTRLSQIQNSYHLGTWDFISLIFFIPEVWNWNTFPASPITFTLFLHFLLNYCIISSFQYV